MAEEQVEVEKDYEMLKLKLAEFLMPDEVKKLRIAFGIPRGIGAKMKSILDLFKYIEGTKPLGESWFKILVEKLKVVGVQLTETDNTYVIYLVNPGSMLCFSVFACFAGFECLQITF